MQVIVDDLLVEYSLTGKGKLVLLLHGWGDSSKGLLALQRALDQKYQVLNVDLPGLGATQAPKEPWNLDNYAQFINHLLVKLDLAQPYTIIGHSNGGALAIRALSTGELSAKRLVLLSAAGLRDKQRLAKSSLKIAAKTGKAATFWLPKRKKDQLRRKLYSSAGSDYLVVPEMQETFKNIVKQDVQADSRMLKEPTLLIYGDKDEATPLIYGKIYADNIKNSKLEIIAGAGHFAHIEQPDKIIALIKEFLI